MLLFLSLTNDQYAERLIVLREHKPGRISYLSFQPDYALQIRIGCSFIINFISGTVSVGDTWRLDGLELLTINFVRI